MRGCSNDSIWGGDMISFTHRSNEQKKITNFHTFRKSQKVQIVSFHIFGNVAKNFKQIYVKIPTKITIKNMKY